MNAELVAKEFLAFTKTFDPLNTWFDELPDPRNPRFCDYTAANIWWSVLLMFLGRAGSRNQFDEVRNSKMAGANFTEISGVPITGVHKVTSSDNAAHHANRVDPAAVQHILHQTFRLLRERRFFDKHRFRGYYYGIIVDGTLQEKCRKGFEEGGKSGGGEGQFRYVLQASLLLSNGLCLPLAHVFEDVNDPVAEKEDCELNAFRRLSQLIKTLLPNTPVLIMGDALYGCGPIAQLCVQQEWKYCFTFKEGRQPTMWDESIRLFGVDDSRKFQYTTGTDAKAVAHDVRWVEDIAFVNGLTATAINEIETSSDGTITQYAWLTNLPCHGNESVQSVVTQIGRERHPIEDQFNVQKNNGTGLGHVFCAKKNASQNYYTMMQLAHVLWTLFYAGVLARLYGWAKEASQVALAHALSEGLRHLVVTEPIQPIGQLRLIL